MSKAPYPWQKNNKPSLIALEPRMLFDGAAAATPAPEPVSLPVADTTINESPHDLSSPVNTVIESADLVVFEIKDQDNLSTYSKEISVNIPISELLAVESTFGKSGVEENFFKIEPNIDPITLTSTLIASSLVREYLNSDSIIESLFDSFSGSGHEITQDWKDSVAQIVDDLLIGKLSIQVEMQSHLDMQGLFGVFASNGKNDKPTIYLNEGWVENIASSTAIQRVLVEEFGHYIDYLINGQNDTLGDEGESFAIDLLNISVSDEERERIAEEDDIYFLTIDGKTVQTEGASITFSAVYEGTPSSASQEANLLSNLQVFNGRNFSFTSTDPNAPYFSGNNVAGFLNYRDSNGNRQQIAGVASRLFKTGSRIEGIYFYYSGLTTSIGDEPIGVEKAYALVFNTNYFTAGGSYGTSSDPVDTALNSFIVPNSAPDAVNDSNDLVLSDAGSGTLNGNLLTNDSDVNNDTLIVSSFS